MRTVIVTGMAVLGAALGGEPSAQDNPVWGIGTGFASCDTFLMDAQSLYAGKHWIDGFWTGLNLNSSGNRTVGHSVGRTGIYGEIKKVCQEHPSKRLLEAARDVYVMIGTEQAKGRRSSER